VWCIIIGFTRHSIRLLEVPAEVGQAGLTACSDLGVFQCFGFSIVWQLINRRFTKNSICLLECLLR
jgi:hypothetical protein